MRPSGLYEKFQAEGAPDELDRTRSPTTTPEENRMGVYQGQRNPYTAVRGFSQARKAAGSTT